MHAGLLGLSALLQAAEQSARECSAARGWRRRVLPPPPSPHPRPLGQPAERCARVLACWLSSQLAEHARQSLVGAQGCKSPRGCLTPRRCSRALRNARSPGGCMNFHPSPHPCMTPSADPGVVHGWGIPPPEKADWHPALPPEFLFHALGKVLWCEMRPASPHRPGRPEARRPLGSRGLGGPRA